MQEYLHDKEEEKEKIIKEIEQLKNELKATNERNEKLRKFNESSEKIDEQLKAQRRTKVTTSLGYSRTGPMETRESFNPKRMKDDERDKSGIKGKKFLKYSCNYCGKLGHKSDVCKN